MRKIAFQIFGERELTEHIRAGGTVLSHCISIRNDNASMAPLSSEISGGFESILNLEFYDVNNPDWLPPDHEAIRIPEFSDVFQAARFFRDSLEDRELTGFTVHCWRGVSRSAGIAAGLIQMVTKDEDRTVDYLSKIRPEALPLPRILGFWDRMLGSNLSEDAEALRAERIMEMRRRLTEDLFGPDDELEELPVMD